MMFGKIISLVENALFPADNKLALANAISNPTETHVDGFGSLLFDTVVGNARSSAVVCLDWGRWLGVAEFFKARTQGARFLSIVELRSKFGFGRAR
jgi:hypothetical protein